MTSTALPDVFRKAADIIGQRGWTRGTDVHPESGGVCANGALRLACGGTVVTTEPHGYYRMDNPADADITTFGKLMRASHRLLDNILDEPLPEFAEASIFKTPKVVTFNDKVAVTGAEIQTLFRKAADYVESHPLSLLSQIEDSTPVPFTVTSAGYQALSTPALVNA